MKKVGLAQLLTAVEEIPAAAFIWHEKEEHNLPYHRHNKGQLMYIDGGAAFLYTRDQTYFLPARHYMWVPAGVEHYFEHRYPTNYIRTIYFFLNPGEQADPFYNKTGIYPVNNLLLEMIMYTAKWDGNILPGTKPFQFLTTLKQLLPEISIQPLPITIPTSNHERIRPILIYIQTHLHEPLSLESVGHTFGFSERTLTRMFRAAMDISFFQYLKLARIIRAMELLLQTDKTISEIAYDTGYNSISAFSNTFQKLVGQRPSAFAAIATGRPREEI